jgi:hypothetical protein
MSTRRPFARIVATWREHITRWIAASPTSTQTSALLRHPE